MERQFSLVTVLCVLTVIVVGCAVQGRAELQYVLSETDGLPNTRNVGETENEPMDALELLQQKDEMMDGLIAANAGEHAKESSSLTRGEYLPGLEGYYVDDPDNGGKGVYIDEKRLQDDETDEKLRLFKWWHNWWNRPLPKPDKPPITNIHYHNHTSYHHHQHTHHHTHHGSSQHKSRSNPW